MTRQLQQYLLEVVRRSLEAMALVLSAQFASHLLFASHAVLLPPIYTLLPWTSAVILLLGSHDAKQHSPFRGRSLHHVIGSLIRTYTIILVGGVVFSFLFTEAGTLSRSWLMTWFLLALAALVTIRAGIYFGLRWLRRANYLKRKRVVVAGHGETARLVHERALQDERSGYNVVRVFNAEAGTIPRITPSISSESKWDSLVKFVADEGIEEVWIALPSTSLGDVLAVSSALKNCYADLRYIPDQLSMELFQGGVSQFLGLPVVDLTYPYRDVEEYLAKELFDKLFSVLALIMLCPLMIAIALAIKWDSPGPLLFRQARHGIGGKVFMIHKFRTMYLQPQGEDASVMQATLHDPRITRVGRFLRRTSLDELPQFFNVLKGDMSVVGPRPHAIAHNQFYGACIADYMQRHRVKPGITGWAQVNGYRGETADAALMAKRIAFDIQYIRDWHFGLDIKIVLLTAIRGWTGATAY